MDSSAIEKKSLVASAWINFLMALSGWAAYSISGSQALLLDGNFSFVSFIAILFAIRIATTKIRRTHILPFGQFIYESFFAAAKGIMIIGMLLMALIVNIDRVFKYLDGQSAQVLNTDIILFYSIIMVLLCFGLAIYHKNNNRKLGNSSTILLAEYTGVKMDGLVSLGVGICLVSIQFISIDGDWAFLHYIGDSLVVIMLVIIFGKGPFIIVRNAFVEIMGGVLQNEEQRQFILSILKKHLEPHKLLLDDYISKTGSNYLVIAYINSANLSYVGHETIKQIRVDIQTELHEYRKHVTVEFLLR